MNDSPPLSERFSAAFGTAVFGAPTCYFFRLVANLILRSSGEVDMIWVLVGIVVFALLGFIFPRSFGRTFTFTRRP